MPARIGVLAVDRRRQSFDGAKKKLVVLISRTLQVADEALYLIGHLIEGGAQFTQLSPAQYFYSPRKVAGSDALSAGRQLAHWPCEFLRKIEPYYQCQHRGQQADEESLIS